MTHWCGQSLLCFVASSSPAAYDIGSPELQSISKIFKGYSPLLAFPADPASDWLLTMMVLRNSPLNVLMVLKNSSVEKWLLSSHTYKHSCVFFSSTSNSSWCICSPSRKLSWKYHKRGSSKLLSSLFWFQAVAPLYLYERKVLLFEVFRRRRNCPLQHFQLLYQSVCFTLNQLQTQPAQRDKSNT